MTPRIHIVVERPDGTRTEREAVAQVTEDMLALAEDLLVTLTTGERPPLKGLYDLCARAFSTSRDDAKERILAASYGMSEAKIEAKSESRGQMLARLAIARFEYTTSQAEVTAWTKEQGQLGALVTNEQAPSWHRYTLASIAYGYAFRSMEAWLDAETSAA
jgi:hypothetical protein